jgi:hypothetical protein
VLAGCSAGSSPQTGARLVVSGSHLTGSAVGRLGADGYDYLACYAAGRCLVWGVSDRGYTPVAVTGDGGQSWDRFHVATVFALLSCTANGSCVALGVPAAGASALRSYTSHDGGLTWARAGDIGRDKPRAMACASSSDCVIPEQTPPDGPLLTESGGASWVRGNGPIMLGLNIYATCAASGWCIAVATGPETSVFTSSDGGRQWTEATSPGDGVFGPPLCPAARSCVLLGGLTGPVRNGAIDAEVAGTMAVTTDGAASGHDR